MKLSNSSAFFLQRAGSVFFLMIALLCFQPSARADTVKLKTGKTYHNVKAFPRIGAHRIQFYNQREILIPNMQIARVRIRPVNWPRPRVVQKFPPVKAYQKGLSFWPQPQEAVPEAYLLQGSWNLDPLWKSAILPGWGQYSLGHKWRGAAFFGGSMLAFGQYLQKRQQHTAAQRSYSEQTTPALLSTQGINGYILFLSILEQEKATLLQRERDTNRMATVLGLVWGWNILDALLLSNPGIVRKYPFLNYLSFGVAGDSATRQSRAWMNASQPASRQNMPGRFLLKLKLKYY